MKLAVVGSSVSSIASMVSTIDATVADGSIARDTSIAVIDTGDDSNVVGVSSGIGVMLGKTVGNLAKGVGIGLRVSLTLAVVVSSVARVADVSSRVSSVVSTVADGAVAGDTSVAVVNTSDHSNVVGVSSGVGIVLGKTVSNLAEGVSIGLSLALFNMPNSNRFDILSISIFSEISLSISISIYSKTALSISIWISIFSG